MMPAADSVIRGERRKREVSGKVRRKEKRKGRRSGHLPSPISAKMIEKFPRLFFLLPAVKAGCPYIYFFCPSRKRRNFFSSSYLISCFFSLSLSTFPFFFSLFPPEMIGFRFRISSVLYRLREGGKGAAFILGEGGLKEHSPSLTHSSDSSFHIRSLSPSLPPSLPQWPFNKFFLSRRDEKRSAVTLVTRGRSLVFGRQNTGHLARFQVEEKSEEVKCQLVIFLRIFLILK